MKEIEHYFRKRIHISDKDWDFLNSKLNRLEIKKKTTLLAVGEIENYISFIEKGVVRYFIPNSEKDITIGINFSKEFASAYDSFLEQTPSEYQMEALSDLVVWQLSFAHLQEIYQQTECGNTIGRMVGEELIKKKSKRLIALLNSTPTQCYLDLLSEQPHIIQLVPLKYIASYIGITPQALSRIRRRIY